ncbi:hypothetical protein BJ138DRAFT_1119369 [Hygrophoropsis aurantiaca]|uniref:Uncharacterized protein n=1 Tax=Hygrophoropsis aurantiaca TaxID=72124 RepID=A0ACB7ZUZ9_9AGAM|nr:hypothetical protein BJ138DRAFT_1119369 [Hygrophoropsis aurantiaca]
MSGFNMQAEYAITAPDSTSSLLNSHSHSVPLFEDEPPFPIHYNITFIPANFIDEPELHHGQILAFIEAFLDDFFLRKCLICEFYTASHHRHKEQDCDLFNPFRSDRFHEFLLSRTLGSQYQTHASICDACAEPYFEPMDHDICYSNFRLIILCYLIWTHQLVRDLVFSALSFTSHADFTGFATIEEFASWTSTPGEHGLPNLYDVVIAYARLSHLSLLPP